MLFVDKVLVAGILVIIFISIIAIILEIYRISMHRMFRRHFQLDQLPPCSVIKKRTAVNQYTLEFPRWIHSNQDGTKDKRRVNNKLRFGHCTLCADNYIVKMRHPINMLKLVNRIRENGFYIEQSVLERHKERAILTQMEKYQAAGSIDSIIETFSEDSYGFEQYCTEIYLAMGIQAKTTPPSNDGGYDIYLVYDNGETAIAECKCYKQTQTIGRPLVQKLVGANQAVGADHMIFITTSTFTQAAVRFAEETGVMLVDGTRLLRMAQTYLNMEDESAELDMEDWLLAPADLRQYMPDDIWNMLT